MKGVAWCVAAIGALFLLLLVIAASIDQGDSADQAKDRARECVQSWQRRFAARGYSPDDAKVASVMQCTHELRAAKK